MIQSIRNINTLLVSKILFWVGSIMLVLFCFHKFFSPIFFKTALIEPPTHEMGYNAISPVPQWVADVNASRPDLIQVYEDKTKLSLGDHYHGYIREFGQGRANIYDNKLYFAASDNSDPVTNGRRYTYKVQKQIRIRHLFIPLALIIFSLFLNFSVARIFRQDLAAGGKYLRSKLQNTLPPSLALILFFILALLSGSIFLNQTTFDIYPGEYVLDKYTPEPVPTAGYNFVGALPVVRKKIPDSFKSRYRMYENGIQLPAQITDHDTIRTVGAGNWSILDRGLIYFSSTDNTSPLENGRVYTLKGPRDMSWAWPIYLLFAGMFFYVAQYPNTKQKLLDFQQILGSQPVFWALHIGVILFFLMLNADISLESVSVFDKADGIYKYQFLGFQVLIGLLVYYLLIGRLFSERISGKAGSLLPFVSLLSVAISTGVAIAFLGVNLDSQTLAGIPWNDANGHHVGALEFLQNSYINEWVGRRPLSALINSDKLLLTGGDIRFLPLASIVLSFSAAYLVFLRLAKIIPAAIAFVFLVVLFPNTITHAHHMLSSNSGLIVACLALVLLIGAGQSRNLPLLVVGTAILSTALFVRAGAFFILPMMGLSGYWLLGPGKRLKNWLNWTWLGAAACFFGLFLSMATLFAFGDSGGSSLNSNSQHTIYGFVHNADWTKIYEDFPDFEHLSLEEQRSLVLSESLKTLKTHPELAVQKFSSNSTAFAYQFLDFVDFTCIKPDNYCISGVGGTQNFVVISFLIAFLAAIFGDGIGRIIILSVIGAFLSASIVYGDGGIRAFGPVAPIYALSVSYSLYLLLKWGTSLAAKPPNFAGNFGQFIKQQGTRLYDFKN